MPPLCTGLLVPLMHSIVLRLYATSREGCEVVWDEREECAGSGKMKRQSEQRGVTRWWDTARWTDVPSLAVES